MDLKRAPLVLGISSVYAICVAIYIIVEGARYAILTDRYRNYGDEVSVDTVAIYSDMYNSALVYLICGSIALIGVMSMWFMRLYDSYEHTLICVGLYTGVLSVAGSCAAYIWQAYHRTTATNYIDQIFLDRLSTSKTVCILNIPHLVVTGMYILHGCWNAGMR